MNNNILSTNHKIYHCDNNSDCELQFQYSTLDNNNIDNNNIDNRRNFCYTTNDLFSSSGFCIPKKWSKIDIANKSKQFRCLLNSDCINWKLFNSNYPSNAEPICNSNKFCNIYFNKNELDYNNNLRQCKNSIDNDLCELYDSNDCNNSDIVRNKCIKHCNKFIPNLCNSCRDFSTKNWCEENRYTINDEDKCNLNDSSSLFYKKNCNKTCDCISVEEEEEEL